MSEKVHRQIMAMRYIKAGFFLALSLMAFYLLDRRQGMVPPMAKFMNPFAGFWLNSDRTDVMPPKILAKNLRDSVVVVWDDRHVPHIFAENAYDLYFTQGFVTAWDRLWQMEFQTNVIAGQLAGILGEDLLEYDIFFRRCGMIYAAENTLKEIHADPETRLMLEAYTDGVNAYIENLNAKNLPVEYKILDYHPEPWTFLRSALIAKFMEWNLTAFDIPELMLTRARNILGEAATDYLYPVVPPFTDPIIPERTPWNFRPLSAPKKPPVFTPTIDISSSGDAVFGAPGSNNWAVGGAKTAGGYPMLCNDFHLPLYLPCMWYEIQLASPDVNVYGASLPGLPLIMVGFNNHTAWGATNAMTDVIDWYEIEFKDSTRSAYLHDSTWLPTRKRIEEIMIRYKKSVVDTVVYTHHGPFVYAHADKPYDARIPTGAAMRWIGHDRSNGLKVFALLNRAKNYKEFTDAVMKYDYPGLNIAFASADGDIAIWHAGKFPLRWHGQGRYISDGRSSTYDWHDYIPKEQLPHIVNPSRGFVSSANQYPVDARYPYFLNGSFWSFDRGARINERLSAMRDVTEDSMIMLQNDILDPVARDVLPLLLSSMDREKLFLQERRNYDELAAWNYVFDVDLIAPTIFTYWWKEISEMTWADDMETGGYKLPVPRADLTLSLLTNKPNSEYFDNKDTPVRERINDVIIKSFHSASNKLFEELGAYGDNWKWGRARKIDIKHLAQIPGMGCSNLIKNGSEYTINVKHTISLGRSWRMVVVLGEKTQAWGNYPGGQSGNPGSRFYDNFIESWQHDDVCEFLFLQSAGEENTHIIGRTVLEGLR